MYNNYFYNFFIYCKTQLCFWKNNTKQGNVRIWLELQYKIYTKWMLEFLFNCCLKCSQLHHCNCVPHLAGRFLALLRGSRVAAASGWNTDCRRPRHRLSHHRHFRSALSWNTRTSVLVYRFCYLLSPLNLSLKSPRTVRVGKEYFTLSWSRRVLGVHYVSPTWTLNGWTYVFASADFFAFMSFSPGWSLLPFVELQQHGLYCST